MRVIEAMNTQRTGAILALAAAWLLLSSGLVDAHEGHVHAEVDETPVVVASVEAGSPRLALHSARLELVAAREGDSLLIYVDDYQSNAPLGGLQVQVQGEGRSAQTEEAAPGLYRLPAGVLDADAQALRIVVRGADWEESFAGSLPAAVDADATTRSPPRITIVIAVAALLAALAIVVLLLERRRRARAAT